MVLEEPRLYQDRGDADKLAQGNIQYNHITDRRRCQLHLLTQSSNPNTAAKRPTRSVLFPVTQYIPGAYQDALERE